jgi:prepilin-type N-terminal cleavage/methylation domain-containing protein
MSSKKHQNRRGFTLIELLVVIAIIGILASVVLSSLNSARASARDVIRKSDVNTIITALHLYYNQYGNYVQSGSGCGSGGNGNGWFSFANGTSYPQSISQCLFNAGFTSRPIADPLGGHTSTATVGNTYMKYSCTLNGRPATFVYAKLEGLPVTSTATDDTCCPTCDSSYGMNYYQVIR